MTIIYLIRHGETDWNHEGRIQGASDIPMNQSGLRQTRNVAAYLEKTVKFPCLLISSDAKRCRVASEILSKSLKIPMDTQKELREVDFGVWNNRKISVLRESDYLREVWDNMVSDHVWEEGESLRSAHKRARDCIQKWLDESGNKNLVVVTHGIIIQLLMSYWITGSLSYSRKLTISNGSVTVITFTADGEARAIALNVVP